MNEHTFFEEHRIIWKIGVPQQGPSSGELAPGEIPVILGDLTGKQLGTVRGMSVQKFLREWTSFLEGHMKRSYKAEQVRKVANEQWRGIELPALQAQFGGRRRDEPRVLYLARWRANQADIRRRGKAFMQSKKEEIQRDAPEEITNFFQQDEIKKILEYITEKIFASTDVQYGARRFNDMLDQAMALLGERLAERESSAFPSEIDDESEQKMRGIPVPLRRLMVNGVMKAPGRYSNGQYCGYGYVRTGKERQPLEGYVRTDELHLVDRKKFADYNMVFPIAEEFKTNDTALNNDLFDIRSCDIADRMRLTDFGKNEEEENANRKIIEENRQKFVTGNDAEKQEAREALQQFNENFSEATKRLTGDYDFRDQSAALRLDHPARDREGRIVEFRWNAEKAKAHGRKLRDNHYKNGIIILSDGGVEQVVDFATTDVALKFVWSDVGRELQLPEYYPDPEKTLVKRWSEQGIGNVEDPDAKDISFYAQPALIPCVERTARLMKIFPQLLNTDTTWNYDCIKTWSSPMTPQQTAALNDLATFLQKEPQGEKIVLEILNVVGTKMRKEGVDGREAIYEQFKTDLLEKFP